MFLRQILIDSQLVCDSRKQSIPFELLCFFCGVLVSIITNNRQNCCPNSSSCSGELFLCCPRIFHYSCLLPRNWLFELGEWFSFTIVLLNKWAPTLTGKCDGKEEVASEVRENKEDSCQRTGADGHSADWSQSAHSPSIALAGHRLSWQALLFLAVKAMPFQVLPRQFFLLSRLVDTLRICLVFLIALLPFNQTVITVCLW